MLGSLAEAQDVVQDAYLRWHQTDRAAVGDYRNGLIAGIYLMINPDKLRHLHR